MRKKLIKEKNKYNLVNLIVILITGSIFLTEYKYIESIFINVNLKYFVILTISVIFVHTIKTIRLYLVLYEFDISLPEHLKIYCKVTPVSVILPFKIGELFRIYCYGRQTKSLYKGTFIILLDRFIDTLALVTMILVISIFNGENIPILAYRLIMFLCIVFVTYFIFPGVYDFWRRILISSKVMKNKITMLKVMCKFEKIYNELFKLIKGRGFLIYILSFIAWGIELASLSFVEISSNRESLLYSFSSYLLSALGNGKTIELKRIVWVSVFLLIGTYIVVKICDVIKARRKCS